MEIQLVEQLRRGHVGRPDGAAGALARVRAHYGLVHKGEELHFPLGRHRGVGRGGGGRRRRRRDRRIQCVRLKVGADGVRVGLVRRNLAAEQIEGPRQLAAELGAVAGREPPSIATTGGVVDPGQQVIGGAAAEEGRCLSALVSLRAEQQADGLERVGPKIQALLGKDESAPLLLLAPHLGHAGGGLVEERRRAVEIEVGHDFWVRGWLMPIGKRIGKGV